MLVRDWWTRARARDWSEDSVRGGRAVIRRFHDLCRSRHGKDYYRPDQNKDEVTWEDARAFLEIDFARRTREGKPLGAKSKRNIRYAVLSFFEFRREEFLDNDQHKRDWENVRDLPTPKVQDEPGSGWKPFALEHVHLILKAARSYDTVAAGDGGGGEVVTRPNEDYEVLALLLYTAGRAQFFGLRTDQPDLERGAIRTRIKGDYFEEIPLHELLVKILRDYLGPDPGRRMLFTSARYAYDDHHAWEGAGPCSYGSCGSREDLRTYFGPEGDVPLCLKHLRRTIGIAKQSNRQRIGAIMARVEEALHRLFPDALEEVWDPQRQAFVRVPIHLHAHRFRETVVTHGLALGFRPEQITELTKHKSDSWKKYNKPSITQMRENVGRVDLVQASEAAGRGEAPVRVRTDLEQVLDLVRDELRQEREERRRMADENRQLRAQLSDLMGQLRTGVVRPDVQDEVIP